ncbi:hypothetical protein PSYMO_35522, partial [Pseudomonas amygdali pv. mori str. 301020]
PSSKLVNTHKGQAFELAFKHREVNCNDLQSKWPRPAIIAFFDRD